MKVVLDGHTAGISPATAYLEHVEMNYNCDHDINLMRTNYWWLYRSVKDGTLLVALVEDHIAELFGMDESERVTCAVHKCAAVLVFDKKYCGHKLHPVVGIIR